MKKNLFLVSLVLTCLCFAGGCGLAGTAESGDETTYGGDMTDNKTNYNETSVLDKGGANGTDNTSIMDYLQDDDLNNSSVPDTYLESDDLGQDANDLLDDVGDAIHNAGDAVEDGIDTLTSPNPSANPSGTPAADTTLPGGNGR